MYASNAFLHSWTFSFGKCTLNIFLWKMYAEHFPLENVRVAKMHFGIKCILASNAFLHQMHFCTAEHFPLENVRWTFSFGKCTRCKNAFLHQMHFCIKCICNILLVLNIFLWKMYAEHFPKENVRWTFSKGKCTRCKNAFLHQMHFCIKCIFASNAFCRFLTFCKQNVRAASLFFAKQKTQHFGIKCILAQLNIFLWKMFSIKCIFAQLNIFQRKMFSTNKM